MIANLLELTAGQMPGDTGSSGNSGAEDEEKNDTADETALSLPQQLLIDDDIARLANATIILPEGIFPLPPYSSATETEESSEFVQPYAIGQLVMVQHRLRRYLLGEVSYVENVMKGESKEITRRKLNQVKQSDTDSSEQITENTDEGQFTGSDFSNEVFKTLCNRSTTTTYKEFYLLSVTCASRIIQHPYLLTVLYVFILHVQRSCLL